jgi:hypothetical protein
MPESRHLVRREVQDGLRGVSIGCRVGDGEVTLDLGLHCGEEQLMPGRLSLH